MSHRRSLTNPLDFGAKADGATDDSGPLNVAIAAAKHLHLSYGTSGIYEIGAALTLKDNLRITADPGVIIRRKSGYTGNLIVDAAALTNVIFDEGFSLDNRSQTGDDTGTTGNVVVLRNGAAGIVFRGGWQILNLGDSRAIHIGIGALNNSDVTIEEGTIKGPSGVWKDGTALHAAVFISNPLRFYYEKNKMLGCGQLQAVVDSSGPASRSVYVRENICESIDATALLIRPSDTQPIEDIEAIGNVGRDIGLTRGKGLVCINDQSSAGGAGTVRNVIVRDNSARHWGALSSDINAGSGADHGNAYIVGGSQAGSVSENVTVSGNNADARNASGTIEDRQNHGIRVFQADGFRIEDNGIIGVGLSGILVIGASASYTAKHGVIAGNDVDQALQITTTDASSSIFSQAGIRVDVGCEWVEVVANDVRNSGNSGSVALGAPDVAGIAVGSSTGAPPRNITVARNNSYDSRGTKYQAYGVRLGDLGSGDSAQPTSVTLEANNWRSNGTGPLKTYYTTTVGKLYRFRKNIGGGNVGVQTVLPILVSPQAGVTWSMPLALTEFLGVQSDRQQFDLSDFDEARVVGYAGGVSAGVGAEIRIMYSTDAGSTWNYLDGAAGPAMDVHSATGNPRVGAWVSISDTAKRDVIIAAWGINGDGAAGLSLRYITLELR